MIESISGLAASYSRPPPAPSLTSSQKEAVQSILSEYDPNNISTTDAKAINTAFAAQGIRPTAELKNVVETAGFDASTLQAAGGPPKGAGGPPPPPPSPPPPQTSSNEDDIIATLLSALEDYQDQTLDASDISDIQSKMQDAGYTTRDNYLDLSA